MTKYAVISPVFNDYYSIGIPEMVPEPTCEYTEVEADTKAKAKVLAVRQWRTEGKIGGYRSYCESDENPFKGLKVENLDAMELEWIEFECLIIDLCTVLAKIGEA